VCKKNIEKMHCVNYNRICKKTGITDDRRVYVNFDFDQRFRWIFPKVETYSKQQN
jgi:hypothetical protein